MLKRVLQEQPSENRIGEFRTGVDRASEVAGGAVYVAGCSVHRVTVGTLA